MHHLLIRNKLMIEIYSTFFLLFFHHIQYQTVRIQTKKEGLKPSHSCIQSECLTNDIIEMKYEIKQ